MAKNSENARSSILCSSCDGAIGRYRETAERDDEPSGVNGEPGRPARRRYHAESGESRQSAAAPPRERPRLEPRPSSV